MPLLLVLKHTSSIAFANTLGGWKHQLIHWCPLLPSFPLLFVWGRGWQQWGNWTLLCFWAAQVGKGIHTIPSAPDTGAAIGSQQSPRDILVLSCSAIYSVHHKVECFKKKLTSSQVSYEEALVQIPCLSHLYQ